MSYESNDLGYDLGYETEAFSRPSAPVKSESENVQAQFSYKMDNTIGGPGGKHDVLPPGYDVNNPDTQAYLKFINKDLKTQETGPASGTPPSGFAPPLPTAPGAPSPNTPSAVSPDAPVVSVDEVKKGHTNGEWSKVRDDLKAYGFNENETNAFEVQNRNRNPADLRNEGVLPKESPKVPDPDTTEARKERYDVGQGIKRDTRDAMINDTASRIRSRFPGESEDSSRAMAEQLYRENGVPTAGGENPDIAAMGAHSPDVNAAINKTFPSGADPSRVSTSDEYVGLKNRTISAERDAFSSAASSELQKGDKKYYSNNAAGNGRTDRDARMFLLERRAADDPGAMRRLSHDPNLGAQLKDFHTRVGNEGTAARPSDNPTRRGLEAALQQDPLDGKNMTPQQRFEVNRADHAHFLTVGENIRAENVHRGEGDLAFAREAWKTNQANRFSVQSSLMQDGLQEGAKVRDHARAMEQQHDSQGFQVFQMMGNMGTQIMVNTINNQQQMGLQIALEGQRATAAEVAAGHQLQQAVLASLFPPSGGGRRA